MRIIKTNPYTGEELENPLALDDDHILTPEDFNDLTVVKKEKVSHPSHYNHFKIEPINYILANSLSFCEGNVVKYISRHSFKGGKDDIFKAIQYCLFILKDTYNITKEELNDTLEKWKI